MGRVEKKADGRQKRHYASRAERANLFEKLTDAAYVHFLAAARSRQAYHTSLQQFSARLAELKARLREYPGSPELRYCRVMFHLSRSYKSQTSTSDSASIS